MGAFRFPVAKGELWKNFHDSRVAANSGLHFCAGYLVAISTPENVSHTS